MGQSVWDAILPAVAMKLIRDLQEGESVTSYSRIRTKQVRSKRNGEPYLRIVFSDSTGRIEGKMWDNIQQCQQGIHEGDVVQYCGQIQVYNGAKQIIIQQIDLAASGDPSADFNVKDLIPSTEGDIEEMWAKLRSLVEEHTSRSCVLELLNNILDKQEKAIKSYPAGIEIHHCYWGGFLEHVLSVLEGVLLHAGRYPNLDEDLLVAGAVLHDIGKLQELGDPYNPVYTSPGQLIGHIVLGCEMVRREVSEIPDFPDDLLLLLEHMIISHQGQLEWGSPRQPLIAEALLLHYIDDLDSKMNRFALVLKEDQRDGDFTQYDRYLGRVIYKGAVEPPSVASSSG